MKPLLTTLLILATLFSTAQDKRFAISLQSLPINEKEALNAGISIEYQHTAFYVRGGLNIYPDFQNHFTPEINASIGYNHHDFWSEWRYYAGATATWAMVGGYHYKSAGPEIGIDRYFNGWFVGVFGNWSYSDLPMFNGVDMGMVLQAGIRIGFEL